MGGFRCLGDASAGAGNDSLGSAATVKSARLDFGPNLSLPVYLETIHDARVKLGNLNDLAARLESERDGFREVASKVQDLSSRILKTVQARFGSDSNE